MTYWTNKFLAFGLVALLAGVSSSSNAASSSASALADKKAQAEAETAAWNAEKAKADAEAAAVKAQFGSLADYKSQGTVDTGTDAGKLESTLMASQATREAASRIVNAISQHAPCRSSAGSTTQESCPPIVVLTEASKPVLELEAFESYHMQMESFRREFSRAIAETPKENKARELQLNAVLPALGAALTGIDIIGNLFRSDYKIAGVAISPDDLLLVKAVVSGAKAEKIHHQFFAPELFEERVELAGNCDSQTNLEAALNGMTEDGNNAIQTKGACAPAIVTFNELNELRDSAAKTSQSLKATKKKTSIARAAAIDAIVKRYDDYIAKISTVDDKGSAPFAAIARQSSIAEKLQKGAYVLILKANFAGGSVYSVQNFWTFFGTMPFYVSGGTLVSYSLFSGENGELIDAGAFELAEPFAKIHKVNQRYTK